MTVSDMKMYRNNSLTMKVLLGFVVAGCLLPLHVGAQVNDIHSFVGCVNSVGQAGGSVANAAAACVPASGCYYTNTMSEDSAQPACRLRDGTRLPRVIFSCNGPGGSQTLRFRPSFSLCTLGNPSIIDHIELGEDVDRRIDGQIVQKMGDISMKGPFPLAEFGAGGVVDTSTPTNKLCNDCHDILGSTVQGSAVLRLFAPKFPELGNGTIGTNDPEVRAPARPVPLSVICAGISNSSQLARNPAKKQLALALCYALESKER